MRLGQHIKRLLEITVVGERAPILGEQRLIAGIGDGRLFEHRGSLGVLAVGTQGLTIGQGRVGILWVGAIAFAIGLGCARRIDRRSFGLRPDRAGHVREFGHRRAAAEARGHQCNQRGGGKKLGRTEPLTHDALTLEPIDRAERASNRLLTLMGG